MLLLQAIFKKCLAEVVIGQWQYINIVRISSWT